jgi:hypothetical protein
VWNDSKGGREGIQSFVCIRRGIESLEIFYSVINQIMAKL